MRRGLGWRLRRDSRVRSRGAEVYRHIRYHVISKLFNSSYCSYILSTACGYCEVALFTCKKLNHLST